MQFNSGRTVKINNWNVQTETCDHNINWISPKLFRHKIIWSSCGYITSNNWNNWGLTILSTDRVDFNLLCAVGKLLLNVLKSAREIYMSTSVLLKLREGKYPICVCICMLYRRGDVHHHLFACICSSDKRFASKALQGNIQSRETLSCGEKQHLAAFICIYLHLLTALLAILASHDISAALLRSDRVAELGDLL